MKHQMKVMNVTRGQREMISKLLLLYANRQEEVEALPFGSVGVILGCKHTRTGDTLVLNQSDQLDNDLPNIVPPPAVMSTSVIPQTQSDLQPVQDALRFLARTDPSVRIDTQEGQLLVHGLGSLHLEIVESRLRDEWAVNFEFGKRTVGYREGLGSKDIAVADIVRTWKTDIAGKSMSVSVELSIRPISDDESGNPLWDGNIVVDHNDKPVPPADSFPDQTGALASIARGIASALTASPHTALPVSRVHITIRKFSYPPHAPPTVLGGASAFILRDYLKKAGLGPLMEPYIRLKITVNEEMLGKVVKDLTEHSGEVLDFTEGALGASDEEQGSEPYSEDGVYVPPKELSPSASALKSGSAASLKRVVYAVAPLSQMLDYSNRLRALSGGHGLFEMENAGFRQVSEARKLEILKELGRA